MSLNHVVRRYPNAKLDEFVLVNSGIYEPADDGRVKNARKLYKRLLKEKPLIGSKQSEITFKEPITYGLIGTGIGALTTGLVASMAGVEPTSKLWLGTALAHQNTVTQAPWLFATLSLEVGAVLGIERYTRNIRRIIQAKRNEKVWESAEFKNDELIHVFAANTDLDSKYDGGALYWLNDKPNLPKTARQYFADPNGQYNPEYPKGHPKAEAKRRSELRYTRFHRDGTFKLYVGEFYERKGQFNDHPTLLYIPYSGLVTGCAIFGPTGSGKSQTLALPFLDQGIGYYHWIDSERDAWLYRTASTASNLRQKALKASGAEREEILKQIKVLETSAEDTLEKMKQGEDAGLGYSKMCVICVEPKDEIWYTQLELCKQFNRVNDYIELGVVRERYQRFQTWSTRLTESISTLWGYAPNEVIRRRMAQWVFDFGVENGIVSAERETTLWFRDIKTKTDAFKKIQPRQTPDKTGSSVLKDLDGIYGDPKKMQIVGGGQDPNKRDVLNEASNAWINRAFQRSNPNRRAAAALNRDMATPDRDQDQSAGEPDLQVIVNQAIAAVPLPWVTVSEIERTSSQGAVLGFGFGLRRDPWVLNAQDQRKITAVMRGKSGQKVVTGTLQRMAMLFALVGDRPRITSGSGLSGVTELVPKRTSGSLLAWDAWRTHYLESMKELFSKNPETQDLLTKFLDSAKDWDDIGSGYLPFPNFEPNAVVQPPQSSAKEGNEPTEAELVVKHYKEALNLMPADRREAVRLRKRVRASAPPARRPMERRYGFRLRYSQWRADRRRVEFNFIEAMLRVVFSHGQDGYEATAKALDHEGKTVSKRVLDIFMSACPSGMIEASARYALHAGSTMPQIVHSLAESGYQYFGNAAEDARRQDAGGVPYDQAIFSNLRADWDTLKRLCHLEAIPLAEDGDRYLDHQAHLKLRRLEEAHREALVLVAMMHRSDLPEEVIALAARIRQVFKSQGGQEEDLRSATWIRNTMDRMRKADLKIGAAYDFNPRVPTIEPITSDPEDYEATIDCESVLLSLGPWDALWSEGIGEKVWEGLRDVARDAMVKAIAIYAEQENDLCKVALVNSEGGSVKWRDSVEGALKARRENAFKGCMSYLGALEGYLRTVSPYYKSNTALPYGFRDSGGIGDCCGATKFNPLHHPDMTPAQTAGLLLGILGRNAGSGDTPFWNDSGVMISDGMISLMRAARGYMTVADLNQMIVSDAFVDLIIAQAEARIEQMRATSGGGMEEHELKETMFAEQWKALYGLTKAEGTTAMQEGECPAEVWSLLPRSASGSEIKELEGYLNAGRTFITSEWRSDTGSFADKEIRSTCKLNLINQLTPVTQGIGAYSFSPEDPDEISFPSPTEMRNMGLVVATRFNYAIDKKLGSIVIGMFIAAYQMMVLSAKQRQTEAKDTFKRISKMLDTEREGLRVMRAKVRSLKKESEVQVAPAKTVQEFLAQVFRQLPGSGTAKADQMVKALLEAERKGMLGGQLGLDSLPGLRFLNTTERSASILLGNVASDTQFVVDYLSAEVGRIVHKREEEFYAKRDMVRNLESRIWTARQEILNGLSELEEFPDWSRLAMFLVDEAHFFLNANAKGSVLTDTDFLSTARAGKSINIYITQTPSSIKGQGMSMDNWEQWISNTLLRICLGAPNKSDQEYISELFRGEKVKKEKEVSYSLSFQGADTDELTGDLRAARVEDGSRNFQRVEEHEKYVSPDELARMPVMSGWVEWTDGQTRNKPHLCYFPPYFAMTSDKVSKVTGEPWATKSWMALVRDGELNLVPPEDERMREIFGMLAQTGQDMSSEFEQIDQKDAVMASGGGSVNREVGVETPVPVEV